MVIFARGHGADCVLIVSLFSLREALEPTGGLRLRVVVVVGGSGA